MICAKVRPQGLLGSGEKDFLKFLPYMGMATIFVSGLLCLLFDLGLTSLSTFFSHIATVSGCGRELNAHF